MAEKRQRRGSVTAVCDDIVQGISGRFSLDCKNFRGSTGIGPSSLLLKCLQMRRAFYKQGSGLLAIGENQLLYVAEADHPTVPSLLAATRSDRPLRSLAVVIVNAGFDLPPLTLVQARQYLEGMVFGSLEVKVIGADTAVISGDSYDPWVQIQASLTSTVVIGGGDADVLWVESGLVLASEFRWKPQLQPSVQTREGADPNPDELPTPERDARFAGHAEDRAPPSTAPSTDSLGSRAFPLTQHGLADRDPTTFKPPPTHERVDAIAGNAQGSPLAEVLDSEADLTMEAIRLAEVRGETHDILASPPSWLNEPSPTNRPYKGAKASDRVVADIPEGNLDNAVVNPDATVTVPPGVVLLDGQESQQANADQGLICLTCTHPNLATANRCGQCHEFLSGSESKAQSARQCILRTIKLSGGGIQLLDSDLVIGRNPTREPLAANQRAVVHGLGDQSVSRRHIVVALDGPHIVVRNLQEGTTKTVINRGDERTPLLPGISHRLEPADTVHYGGAWFQYIEEYAD